MISVICNILKFPTILKIHYVMFKVSIIQMALQKTIDLLQAFITINKILFFSCFCLFLISE